MVFIFFFRHVKRKKHLSELNLLIYLTPKNAGFWRVFVQDHLSKIKFFDIKMAICLQQKMECCNFAP